jgi:outer membrane immunogenic protein
MKMRKYLMATALVGLGSAPTIAADLAARPYTKAPALAAVYDWTGFYIGVNAGVGLGRDRFQHDWLGEEGIYSFYTSPQGGFGGGQIGYNWQTGSILGPIVLGVEADIQGAGLSDDRTNFVIGASKTSYGQKLDWFGTAAGGSVSPMVRC